MPNNSWIGIPRGQPRLGYDDVPLFPALLTDQLEPTVTTALDDHLPLLSTLSTT